MLRDPSSWPSKLKPAMAAAKQAMQIHGPRNFEDGFRPCTDH